MKKMAILTFAIFIPLSLTIHPADTQKESCDTPYKPLIIKQKGQPFMPFEGISRTPSTKLPRKDALYMLYKNSNNLIDAQEYQLRRYPADAVYKSPFWHPEQGFKSIIPSQNETHNQRPFLIKEYAEFIKQQNRGSSSDNGEWFARLFFYADTDKLSPHNKSLFKPIEALFKAPVKKPIHPLISTLSNIKSHATAPIRASISQIIRTTALKYFNRGRTQAGIKAQSSPFYETNIFVAQSITLEDLKKQVHEKITLQNDKFYLENSEEPKDGLMLIKPTKTR